MRTAAYAALVVGAVMLLPATVWAPNTYVLYLIGAFAISSITGLGLNVLFGLIGEVSLGQAGLVAIGAYTCAILLTRTHVPFWVAAPAAILVTTLAGVALSVPALRVRGPYLAMVTIAFGIIVQHAAIEFQDLTGGFTGISAIPKPAIFGHDIGQRGLVVTALGCLAASLFAYAAIADGPWGRAMRAVRDSETAAAAIGIAPVVPRTLAFAIGAAAAGLGGALFAPLAGYINPQSFDFQQSIVLLLGVILGGAGTLLGPLLGSAILALLPELLSNLAEYRLLVFGALLLGVMWFAPRGILGAVGARRASRAHGTSLAVGSATRAIAYLMSGDLGQTLCGRSITVNFGGVRAVDGVDFDAQSGSITAIIGPNGAGKTTLLNVAGGYYRLREGSLELAGRSLKGFSSARSARAGIGRTFQAMHLFESMSARDNVRAGLDTVRAADRCDARDLLALAGYAGDPDAPVDTLAFADRRFVEIARALSTRPSFVLFDEPAGGLHGAEKAALANVLDAIAHSGVGVVLIEHDMALVMQLSHAIFVLDAGKRIAAGPPQAIAASETVRRAYLGEPRAFAEMKDSHRTCAPSAEIALQVRALHAGYAGRDVLHGVSLEVRRGEFVSVVGANGAGKSTLLKAVFGLLTPSSGTVSLHGHAVAMVPEGRQLFPELSVRDNILLGARDRRGSDIDVDIEAAFVRFPRLRERAGARAGLLSGGEAQMVALARALIARPSVLILDEPSLGLAPKFVLELFETLRQLRDEGMTILLVDQMVALAFAIADRAYVLENGTFVLAGDPRALRDDPRVAQAYVGPAREPGVAAAR